MKKLIKCPLCDKQYDNICSISKHYSRTHHLKSKDLYLKLNGLKKEPTCACGCGSSVKFLDCGRGFSEYKWGHAAKVPGKNNWGNNEKALEKSHATVRKMIKEGTHKPFFEKETGKHWADGKTMETDERVARAVIARETPEHKVKAAKRMSENRLNGTIPSLYGKEHPKWAGGTSPLNHTCHANTRLYKEWKYPILVAGGFKCSKCGSTTDLHVHHDKVKFATILHLIAETNGWEDNLALAVDPENPTLFELKQKISNEVAEYHINNKVSGVVLCEEHHKELHEALNF